MQDIERWYFYLKGNLEQLATNPAVIAMALGFLIFAVILGILRKTPRVSPARKRDHWYW